MRLFPALLLLTGCFGPPTEVDFGDPSLLGPLEPVNLAPEVQPVGDDAFPEVLTIASGHDDENDRYWAHARGWIKADSADVWASLRNLDVYSDRRSVDEYELIGENTMPEFDFSFVVANHVNDVIAVNYDLTWVHELQEGTITVPESIAIQWDKTDGTQFIDLLSGSVIVRRVDGGLCEIEYIEHLRAAARDEETLELYLGDVYADLRAHVHGEPLPTFE
ncbi:MAG: hypothetical protein R3F61_27555 [Myxococcota bacterium]